MKQLRENIVANVELPVLYVLRKKTLSTLLNDLYLSKGRQVKLLTRSSFYFLPILT